MKTYLQKKYSSTLCITLHDSVKIIFLILFVLGFKTVGYSQGKYVSRKTPVVNNSISTDIAGENFCPGNSVSVSFSATGTYQSDNSFIAQLSNAFGSFEHPVELGKISMTMGNRMYVSIPSDVKSGMGYRIRVTSTNPKSITHDNHLDISIKETPEAKIQINKPVNFSEANPVLLTASAGEMYTWSNGEQTRSIAVSEPGTYTVKVANTAGCGTVSLSALVTADPPTFATSVATADTKGKHGSITILAIGGNGSYEYSVDGGASFSTNNVFKELKSGLYPVVIRSNEIASAIQNISVPFTNRQDLETEIKSAKKERNQNAAFVKNATSEIALNSVKAYPNPTDQNFSLSLNNLRKGKAIVQIMSLEGYVVFQQWVNIVANRQTLPISLDNPIAGTYILKVISGKDIQTAKVIVKG